MKSSLVAAKNRLFLVILFNLPSVVVWGSVAAGDLLVAPRGTGGSSVDDLLRAGQQADRNGLTKAGRALQKHGDRTGSVFPQSAGNAAARNLQGQNVLEGILNSGSQTRRGNRFGGQDIFDTVTGRGARFDGNGNFIGFLEP